MKKILSLAILSISLFGANPLGAGPGGPSLDQKEKQRLQQWRQEILETLRALKDLLQDMQKEQSKTDSPSVTR